MTDRLREDMRAALEVQERLREARQHCWLSFDSDDGIVHVLLELPLHEAQHRGKPLGGQYSATVHPPHDPRGQKHIHVYAKQNNLLALNWDGSTRHGKPGTRIPARVAAALAQRFPDLKLPDNNILEHLASTPAWMRYVFD